MPNNDLILRAAVKEAVRNSIRGGATELVRVFKEIDNAPAVDAAPVVHARWIQHEPDLHGTKPIECGACHYLFARLYPRDFCSHCGAKMDGDDE